MNKQWYFLGFVGFIYLITLVFAPQIAINSIAESFDMLIKVIPALIFVFIIMVLINLYVKKEKLKKLLGESKGTKKWLISIGAGIISMGPIYIWYPLLKDFREKGASYGFISAFLYARSFKPFLIPVMVAYFGIIYTILLSFLILIGAFFQGLIFEKLDRYL